jgi:hypothetical protein
MRHCRRQKIMRYLSQIANVLTLNPVDYQRRLRDKCRLIPCCTPAIQVQLIYHLCLATVKMSALHWALKIVQVLGVK